MKPITIKFLTDHGFELVADSPFDNFSRSYYAKDCILVFVNDIFPEEAAHVAIGEQHMGVYRAVGLKFVKTQGELLELFKVVKGYELKNSKAKVKAKEVKPTVNCKCIRFAGGDKWHRNGCRIHKKNED